MTNFRYTAMTSAGAIVTGEMDGPSPKAVIEHLQGLGHYPISTIPARRGDWRSWPRRQWEGAQRASQRDLSIATHELATLLHAGLPLDRALEILKGLAELRRLRRPLEAVLDCLRDGAPLAEALAAESKTFPKLYVSLVRAGELGGSLEAALYRLAEYLAKAHAVREAIKSAMVYPTILLATAGFAIAAILVFVLPEFEPLFRAAGTSLPASTQIIVTAGHLVGGYWWLLLLGFASAAAAVRRALRHPAFRLRWDRTLLRLPLAGALAAKIDTERLARTLGTLLADGVTLPTALAITRDTLRNAAIAKAIGDGAATLREGGSLTALLAKTKVLPAFALDLVRVGEETGRLEEMLLRQADICDREVKHTIDRLLALLVPAITIALGFVVAGLIASLFSAILSINDLALH